MAWWGAANSVISEATRPQLEHVIGVQGINDRVILRVSTLQIAADRGTGRNPGATRFSSQTITARVTRLLVSGDFGRHALQNACPASSLPRLTPINHEADGGPVRSGRASFLMSPRPAGAGWRDAHSSQPTTC